MRIVALPSCGIAVYFFVIGYWILGAMVGVLGVFALWQWRRLNEMIERARVDAEFREKDGRA